VCGGWGDGLLDWWIDGSPPKLSPTKHSRGNATNTPAHWPKGKEQEQTEGNGEGNQNLCSLRSLLFKSGPGGVVELDFDKSISDGVNIYANPKAFGAISSSWPGTPPAVHR